MTEKELIELGWESAYQIGYRAGYGRGLQEGASKEREACAKVCDAQAENAEMPRRHLSEQGVAGYRGAAIAAAECAHNIRSRVVA